ncbi:hypothetical protein PAECIP111892_00169 [Paenibacillus auburnensis]|uniref:N-acetyltransferase domain-containing protein n=1 Tax=Paenibacillus auburnensis TaxID=2905649 RepID=A0ABM9BMM5_9BACL|nr:GNAT family protein [Paenibacillus auburnensis]CAH1190419.1 hypothetical protein PAECIP111892_00169 [Paenibacillus auburnensis]
MANDINITYKLRLMEKQDAFEIGKWKYEPPYSLYNSSDDQESLEELLDGSYYAVITPEYGLTGFFCYGRNAQVPGGVKQGLYTGDNVLDIGLGLKPEYTGTGLGKGFLQAGIQFAESVFTPEKFRLTVAAFNQRAIALYSHAGFRTLGSFIKINGESQMEFLVMER